MGKIKEEQIKKEEEAILSDEEQLAQQEAYYYYVIQEFYAICKVFGTTKVMADLAELKKVIEKPEDKPRIQLL
jgi:hypothetical protein